MGERGTANFGPTEQLIDVIRERLGRLGEALGLLPPERPVPVPVQSRPVLPPRQRRSRL